MKCGIATVKLGTFAFYVFLCKGHFQILIGAQFLFVSTYKFFALALLYLVTTQMSTQDNHLPYMIVQKL